MSGSDDTVALVKSCVVLGLAPDFIDRRIGLKPNQSRRQPMRGSEHTQSPLDWLKSLPAIGECDVVPFEGSQGYQELWSMLVRLEATASEQQHMLYTYFAGASVRVPNAFQSAGPPNHTDMYLIVRRTSSQDCNTITQVT